MSRLPFALFVLTACIAALLMIGLCREEPESGHGTPHPQFSEMNQGGDPSRHDGLILLGGVYGGLQIVLLVAGLCLGIRADRSSCRSLIVAGAAYLAVCVAMVATYARGQTVVPLVMGIPLPTSLMVFGMWGMPALFVALYHVKFEEWVLNEQDRERFRELLEKSAVEETDV